MSSREIKKYHKLVFSEVCLKYVQAFCWSPFLVAVFCRFLFQAKMECFNEIHQNVNELVLRDKVE